MSVIQSAYIKADLYRKGATFNEKFVLIFVTAVAVASVSVFAAYNLPENTDASKYENTHTMASTVINKSLQSLLHRRMLI